MEVVKKILPVTACLPLRQKEVRIVKCVVV